jgi:hypothetical protein
MNRTNRGQTPQDVRTNRVALLDKELDRFNKELLQEAKDKEALGILSRGNFIKLDAMSKLSRKRVRDSVVHSDKRYKSYEGLAVYSVEDFEGANLKREYGGGVYPLSIMFKHHKELLEDGWCIGLDPIINSFGGVTKITAYFKKPKALQAKDKALLFEFIKNELKEEYAIYNGKIDDAQNQLDAHWIALDRYESVTKPDKTILAEKAREARSRQGLVS